MLVPDSSVADSQVQLLHFLPAFDQSVALNKSWPAPVSSNTSAHAVSQVTFRIDSGLRCDHGLVYGFVRE
tara:strand:- start:7196 stop:7405 length:210 start_codon:yes stop_codon:yes gene_type:complete